MPRHCITMPASRLSHVTMRTCFIWREKHISSQSCIVDGCGIVRTISTFMPLSLRRRCLTSFWMIQYIVYLIWWHVVSPCTDKTHKCVNVSGCEILTLLLEDVIQHLHLLTLGFCSRRRTIALQLYSTWCLWELWSRTFQWEGPMRNSFLMVDYCRELEHLFCASWRSVSRGICSWLRSWLACRV